MATINPTYLFNITICIASIYVDQTMQSGILRHTSLLDTALNALARTPGILRAFPSMLLRKMATFYREGSIQLANGQKVIHDLDYEDALIGKRQYEKGLRLLGALNPNIEKAKPAEKELFLAVLEVVKKLRENVFLMDLIINHELEPDDRLADLLEDYHDGLLVEQRKGEERFPWEQVVEIGNRKDVYD